MPKIKIAAAFSVLLAVGIVYGFSPSFASTAKTDVSREIAKYKTWTKLTKEPIAVRIDIAALGGG